jgi:hypothetical protein
MSLLQAGQRTVQPRRAKRVDERTVGSFGKSSDAAVNSLKRGHIVDLVLALDTLT